MDFPQSSGHKGTWETSESNIARVFHPQDNERAVDPPLSKTASLQCPEALNTQTIFTDTGGSERPQAIFESDMAMLLYAEPSLTADSSQVNMTTVCHPWHHSGLSAQFTPGTAGDRVCPYPRTLPRDYSQNASCMTSFIRSTGYGTSDMSEREGHQDQQYLPYSSWLREQTSGFEHVPPRTFQSEASPFHPQSHDVFGKASNGDLRRQVKPDRDHDLHSESLGAKSYPYEQEQWQSSFDKSIAESVKSLSSSAALVGTGSEAAPGFFDVTLDQSILDTSLPFSDDYQPGALGLFFPSLDRASQTSTAQSAPTEAYSAVDATRYPHTLTTTPRIDPSSASSFEALLAEAKTFLDSQVQMHPHPVLSASGPRIQPDSVTSPKSIPASIETTGSQGQQTRSYKESFADVDQSRGDAGFGIPELPSNRLIPKQSFLSGKGSGSLTGTRQNDQTDSATHGGCPVSRAVSGFPSGPKPRPLCRLSLEITNPSILILDRKDRILRSSDTFSLCSVFFQHSDACKPDIWKSIAGAGTFSDLLADPQTIGFWQQACREVLLRVYKRNVPRINPSNGAPRSVDPGQALKKLFLRLKSEHSQEDLAEVTVRPIGAIGCGDDGCLMVQVRRMATPTVAAISSQPMQTAVGAIQKAMQSSGNSALSGEIDRAKLRLLVSRYGLVLRSTCPLSSIDSPKAKNITESDRVARAVFAILGEGATLPSIGQSLVEVPKLSPLLHVIAQAAVVGLARTVNFTSGGRQITATVQPVLRNNNMATPGVQRPQQPAAKVWVTLTAPATITRRPQSSLSSTTTGFASSLADFIATGPIQESMRRYSPNDRRHSLESLLMQSFASATSFQTMLASQTDRRASIALPFTHATTVGDTPPWHTKAESLGKPQMVQDSLDMLMIKLREENDLLRREVETRLRRLQTPATYSRSLQQPSEPASKSTRQFFNRIPGGKALPDMYPSRLI